MIELIGIALLIYGIVGVVGSLVIYWWMVRPAGPIEKLKDRLTYLAARLQEGALLARRANEIAPRVSDISQKAYENLGEIIRPIRHGAVVLDDAALLMRGTERLLNGAIDRVLGPSEQTEPQMDFQVSTGTQLGEIKHKVDKIGDLVSEVKYFSRDAKIATDELIRDLEPLPNQLEEGRQMVLEINQSRWVEAVPALITTYFGLTHVAFALIGLALWHI